MKLRENGIQIIISNCSLFCINDARNCLTSSAVISPGYKENQTTGTLLNCITKRPKNMALNKPTESIGTSDSKPLNVEANLADGIYKRLAVNECAFLLANLIMTQLDNYLSPTKTTSQGQLGGPR